MTTKSQNNSNDGHNDWNESDDESEGWEDWGDANEIEGNESAQKIAESVVEKNDSSRAEQCTRDSTTLSWGGRFTSVLSTASEGLGNITATMNNIIGAPDPEDLARQTAAEQAQRKKSIAEAAQTSSDMANAEPDDSALGFQLFGGVSALGNKVLSSGLGTLGGISKKTYGILQERELMQNPTLGREPQKPNLSALLKEAKRDADEVEQTMRRVRLEKMMQDLSFSLLFENYAGSVHLEALEILSRESKLKVESLMESVDGKELQDMIEVIDEVKELLELEELESQSEGEYSATELNERLHSAIEDADVSVSFEDITEHWSQALKWLDAAHTDELAIEELYREAITTLSKSCALQVSKLHKFAELLLVKQHHSTANEVDGIAQLCKQFIAHLHGITNRFAGQINAKDASESTKQHVNQLFKEMLCALQHIEQCYKLFLPILQIGAV